jgi:hypothetical protein
LIFSLLAVAAGWVLYFRKKVACADGCERPRRSWLAASILTLSSLLIVAAIGWNAAIEPQLLILMRQ